MSFELDVKIDDHVDIVTVKKYTDEKVSAGAGAFGLDSIGHSIL